MKAPLAAPRHNSATAPALKKTCDADTANFKLHGYGNGGRLRNLAMTALSMRGTKATAFYRGGRRGRRGSPSASSASSAVKCRCLCFIRAGFVLLHPSHPRPTLLPIEEPLQLLR